jgi:hypothetical protein
MKRIATTAIVALAVLLVARRQLDAAYEAGRMEQYRFWNHPYPGISVEHILHIERPAEC